MNMKKTSARLGAGTLALATVVAGLSFGPAATAAPAQSGARAANALAPTQLIFANGSKFTAATDAVQTTYTGTYTKTFDTLAQAKAGATTYYVLPTEDGWYKIANSTAGTGCLAVAGSAYNSNRPLLNTARGATSCSSDADALKFRSLGGKLYNKGYGEPFGEVFTRGSSGFTAVDALGFAQPGLALDGDAAGKLAALRAEVSSTDLRARTADLTGFAVAGSTVIINDTIAVPVGADGKWSYTITGLKLGKNTIKVEQYEGANNKTGEASVVADLAVAPITANAVFLADVTKPLTISGTAQAGANVEIWNGTTKLVTVPAADVTGAYTAEIPAPNAGGMQSYTVKQVLQGETAPDVKTVTADFGAQVSIVTPVNDMIHDGGALRFQGRGVPGGTVELRERGKQGVIGTAPVLDNGIWTLDTTIPGKKATYVATMTGKGNNVTTASVTLNPDGDVNPPVVNPVTPGSNHLIGSGGTPGATIIVRDEDGNEIGRDVVDADGNWDVTVPPTLGPGKHDLEIVERNDDGDESDPTKVTVDFGAAIVATNAVADDKGIVTYTGTGQAGATVEVKGKSGRVLATTTVKADGTWTAVSTMALPAQTYTVDAFQSTGIGVKSSSEISFEVKNTTPVAKAVQFTGPARNSTVFTNTPTFSGTGEPGANIKVGGTVRTVGETTVKADGTWTVKSNVALENDSYALRALQTPANGAAQSTDTNPFTITYKAAEKLQVLSPAADSTVAGPRPTFTGTGDAGATITIKGATRTVATAVVQNDGTWTATSTIDLAKDVYNLTVAQDALNGDMEQTTVKFTVK